MEEAARYHLSPWCLSPWRLSTCLQGRDKSRHELVHPEYFFAAFDHDDIASPQKPADR
jgi:hypothetical protein